MSEIASTYHVSTVVKPPFATVIPAIDPRARIALIAFRRALLMAAGAIDDYLKAIDETVK